MEQTTKRLRFMLNGCDIAFLAEAPADITLEQLLRQCDKIHPDWCACGIRSVRKNDSWEMNTPSEIIIDYDSVRKGDEDVPCRIIEA